MGLAFGRRWAGDSLDELAWEELAWVGLGRVSLRAALWMMELIANCFQGKSCLGWKRPTRSLRGRLLVLVILPPIAQRAL